jgi:hypothetical protein
VRELPLLVVRVLAGGALVSAFAVAADALRPKMFAGLFAGAPSVAMVSLLVTGLAMGAADDGKLAAGMTAGAVGLVFYALTAALLVRHMTALVGSALAWAAWLFPAGAVYMVFLR